MGTTLRSDPLPRSTTRITNEDSPTCEQRALDLCRSWAKSMGIPKLAIRTDLPAAKTTKQQNDKQ